MEAAKTKKPEPIKLKIILPLLIALVLLVGLIFYNNLSKPTFDVSKYAELATSFSAYISKLPSREKFKLFESRKQILLNGSALKEVLADIEGGEVVDSLQIELITPVFLNLTEDWLFSLDDSTLSVQAPNPIFGDTFVETKNLGVKFLKNVSADQSSFLTEHLRQRLTSFHFPSDQKQLRTLSQESLPQIEDFLRGWMNKTFSKADDVKLQISFSQ